MSEEDTARIFDWLEETAARLKPTRPTEAVKVRDHAIFEVFYSAGLRKSELICLQLDDISYDDGVIMVREGKGGKDRVVPVGTRSLEALRRYVRLARSILVHGETSLLFLSIKGCALGEVGVIESVKRTAKAAGITRNISPYAVRHTCATHMLNRGADIRYVQEFLGHESLSTTQVYTHVSIDKLKETHRNCHPREQSGFMDQVEDK
jgi:site-specific recombinase XerD